MSLTTVENVGAPSGQLIPELDSSVVHIQDSAHGNRTQMLHSGSWTPNLETTESKSKGVYVKFQLIYDIGRPSTVVFGMYLLYIWYGRTPLFTACH